MFSYENGFREVILKESVCGAVGLICIVYRDVSVVYFSSWVDKIIETADSAPATSSSLMTMKLT